MIKISFAASKNEIKTKLFDKKLVKIRVGFYKGGILMKNPESYWSYSLPGPNVNGFNSLPIETKFKSVV